MKNRRNPSWWTAEYDSSWERVKAAFRRDWDQTKHDFGGKQPDLDQNVGDTAKQAAGKEAIPPRGVPNFDEDEAALKFGFGARRHFRSEYPSWNDELEARLKEEWQTASEDQQNWERQRQTIRRGWNYDDNRVERKAA